MAKKILVKPSAVSDLQNIFEYFAEHNSEVALKFFDAARQTFAHLAQMPNMGKRYSSNHSRFGDLRQWAVKGFRKYLIFYLISDEQIEVVRVIHAAQDLEVIFEDDD